MTHDRYDKDILKQLTRIANSLGNIEKKMPLQKLEKGETYLVNNCDQPPMTNESKDTVNVNFDKTLDEMGMPNCWRCKNYNKDFGTCFWNVRIDLAENTCCTEFERVEE